VNTADIPVQERIDRWLCQFLKIVIKLGLVALVAWQALILRALDPGVVYVAARPTAFAMLMGLHAFLTAQIERIELRRGTGPWPRRKRRPHRRDHDPPVDS
jgi:hypothetical protein